MADPTFAELWDMIDKVSGSRHWTAEGVGRGFTCKCDECRAIKQVCALAHEALERRQSNARHRAKHAVQLSDVPSPEIAKPITTEST